MGMITLLSLMTDDERVKASKSLNAIEICSKLFIDINVADFARLCRTFDIFDHAYTEDLFKDLYKRFGDRCIELKHEML